SASVSESGRPPEEAGSTETDESIATGESTHRFVQDLWIYERLSTVDVDGDEIDLTDAVVEGLDDRADRAVELIDGVTFYVHDSLDASVTDADGVAREDLDVVAGVIEHDGDRVLSVLATPGDD